MLLQFFFSLGLGFIFSTLQVFFRDTAQLVNAFLLIWMFGTPLFYPERMIPAHFRFLVDINPMAYLVRMFRAVCLKNVFPDAIDLIVFVAFSLIFLVIGYSIYTRKFYQFIDQL
jgi:ABC-type polysaccharide/polyol phosphate export permease